MTNGRENLRVAIIKQAITDYKKALTKGDDGQIQYLENWFLSDWGQMLSDYKGEQIIEKIKGEFYAEAE